MSKAKSTAAEASPAGPQVQLVPHVGRDEQGNEVIAAQDQIMVTLGGKQVRFGYVPHDPEPPILWIHRPTAEVQAAVEALVEASGRSVRKNAVVPRLTDEKSLDRSEGRRPRRE